MTDLPDWIDRRLDDNIQRDLRQRPVAEVVWESREPYLSRTVIQQRVGEKLEDTFDKSTVIGRLDELVERDVFDSDEVCGGSIYWIHDDRSNWPIPPDVEVEPVSDEMTVQEFFQEDAVKLGAGGIAAFAISGLIMWFGAWASANNFTLYGFGAVDILTVGFALIISGWLAAGVSALWWFGTNPTLKRTQ